MDRPIRVLFLESQTSVASDSQVQNLLMQHCDQDRIEVYAACSPGSPHTPSQSIVALRALRHVRVVPTEFGPPVAGLSRRQRLASLPRYLSTSMSLARLIAYARRHRIDVIHAASRPRDALLAVVVAKLVGARCVIHLHVQCSHWFGRPLRWALAHCDGIIGVSDFVARSIVAAGYPPHKAHSLRNTLNAALWDPHISGTAVREALGIDENAPLLAIVSRLFYWKGHTDLLRALALVKQRHPGVVLLIVGDDDPLAHPGAGSYKEELRSLAAEIGLAENVVFAGFRKDVQQVLAACDIYAMPSFEEPLGLAFLEAMAMEKPVVALDSGGVPEVVEHGRSGLLSQPHDIEALAANILALIEQPPLRTEMGKAGRACVEQCFRPGQMAERAYGIYRLVLGVS